MKVISARNVQGALPMALDALNGANATVERETRNGPVIQFVEPVTTVYGQPHERVIFWPQRDANPFFHLFEAIWMMAGRNDVEPVAAYVANMRNYSDDGVTFHGAYGYRWRYSFGFDQLATIILALRKDPTCRRQVLSMWDASIDLARRMADGSGGKDLPCNLQALFSIGWGGALDMLVTNRSNDLVWGAYGANAVHFSFLHEFMASAIGVPLGRYRQMSNNLHVYKATLAQVEGIAEQAWNIPDPYAEAVVRPYPIMAHGDWANWLSEAQAFVENPGVMGLTEPFFRRVAVPMHEAYFIYKNHANPHRFDEALERLQDVKATDWRMAAKEWIGRRLGKFLKANDNGVAYD